jgi:hypothetical protein
MPAVPAASWAVRVGGLVALVLGLFIWVLPGAAEGVRPLHMVAGLAVAIGLLVLALFSFRGGSPAMPLVAIGWAILLPAFGLTQASLLTGGLHFLVQLAHLAVGVISIGIGEALALRIVRTERRLRNTR